MKKTLINDWLTFVKVVEVGSFSSAAKELNVTTGTVSKIIAKMEATLETQLLYRSAHKCEVTDIGKVTYEKALTICQCYHSILAKKDKNNGIIQGVMRLSAPSIVCDNIASTWITDYVDLNPDVVIHLLSRDSGNFTIDSPEFDDLVLKSGYIDSPDLVHRPVKPISFGIYSTPEYLSKNKPMSVPEHMEGHSILKLSHFYLKPPIMLSFNDEYKELNFTPGREMVSNNVLSLINMTLQHKGICIAVPDWVVRHHVESGQLIKLFPDYKLPDMQVHLVWRYRKHYSPLFIDFRNFIEKRWNEFFDK